MAEWLPPQGIAGNRSFVRTGLWAARDDPRGCPMAGAIRARPAAVARSGSRRAKDPLETFGLGTLMSALDVIEFGQRISRRERPAHDGLAAWSTVAASRFVAARQADQSQQDDLGLPRTSPVKHLWVARHELQTPDHRGVNYYEQTCWGRRYASSDGSVREIWLPRFRAAGGDRGDAELAAAAYVAAFGDPCAGGAFRQRHIPLLGLPAASTARPHRVRVIEFGCADGSAATLLDWDSREVARRYAAEAVPVLARTVEGTGRVPGSDCVNCLALAGCPALHRSSGILGIQEVQGIAAVPRPRRSLSASDLRAYAACPAQYHLTRQLKLRGDQQENEAIRRGRAVDAWLNMRHAARPVHSCRGLPGPRDPGDWSAGGVHVVGAEARNGARMIAQHAAVCPVDGLADGEKLLVQRQVTSYDPELDLLLVATPDLLYTQAGGWIWRETKTATSYLWSGRPLLQQYPQLALAVLLVAAGALGGDEHRCRIELELLYPDDCGVEEIDPGLETTVTEARAVIAGLARSWNQDTTYPPRPGRQCDNCEAVAWCQPGQQHRAGTGKATATATASR